MARRSDNLRMLGKLLVVTLGMFAFGYLLIPAYKAICEATGVNILSLTERQVPGNGVGLRGDGAAGALLGVARTLHPETP